MGYGFTLLIIVLLLAAVGVTRWDLLRARIDELFTPPPPPAAEPPATEARHVPRHLHDEQLQHQAPHARPAIHRSGRRG